MRRLSSSSTYFYKRVFPFLWCGVLLFVLVFGWWGMTRTAAPMSPRQLAPLLFAPLLIGAVGMILFRWLIRDLVDGVSLDGDWLVVNNRGEQRRVALADVMNINSTSMTNPRRITVLLRTDSRLGRSFSFIPASPRGLMTAFRPDPIASELIGRVDALRGPAR